MAKYKTHYEILGIPENASEDEINSAFRKILFETHPDNPENKGKEEMLRAALEARKTLLDPQKRSAYDAQLKGNTFEGRWQEKPANDERNPQTPRDDSTHHGKKAADLLRERLRRRDELNQERERKDAAIKKGNEKKAVDLLRERLQRQDELNQEKERKEIEHRAQQAQTRR